MVMMMCDVKIDGPKHSVLQSIKLRSITLHKLLCFHEQRSYEPLIIPYYIHNLCWKKKLLKSMINTRALHSTFVVMFLSGL